MKLLKLVKKIYKVEKELDILQNEAGELLKNLDAVEYENERLERTNKKKEEDLENYKKLADSMVRMADEESHKIVCTFGTATGTNGLTEEEKELLKKGIMEEIEKDVRMHAGMPRETEKLCARYKQSNFNSFYEGVLKKCANYWRTYFAEGKNAADAELEAEYKRQMEEGKALLENAKSNSIKDAMAVVTN